MGIGTDDCALKKKVLKCVYSPAMHRVRLTVSDNDYSKHISQHREFEARIDRSIYKDSYMICLKKITCQG